MVSTTDCFNMVRHISGFRGAEGFGRDTPPPLKDAQKPRGQFRVYIVLWESSENQFGRPKKKGRNFQFFFSKIRPLPSRNS